MLNVQGIGNENMYPRETSIASPPLMVKGKPRTITIYENSSGSYNFVFLFMVKSNDNYYLFFSYCFYT